MCLDIEFCRLNSQLQDNSRIGYPLCSQITKTTGTLEIVIEARLCVAC